MNSYNSQEARLSQLSLVTKIGFLFWAASITLLYWLAHGPYGPLMKYSFIAWGREFMMYFFKARYVFNQ